jgi:tagaturonate reductase
MQLSKHTIKKIAVKPGLIIPDKKLFALPEKVLQFGTGVLLRGLPDYFIDKANREGIFNGRIVVVKSTDNGGTDEFGQQDGLYTICIRGVDNGRKMEEFIINSSISRVLSAKENWNNILECAHNPEMQIIISNTTEVGITLMEDNIHNSPPLSFPGKLLAFLVERYNAFKGAEECGMVIIPTELITENGTKLRSIVLELAKMNKLDESLINWLKTANHFCNSLVDRIVPGKLSENDKHKTENELGYTDGLMIMAESFRLWAIESGSERVRQVLSFAKADEAVVIAPSIEKFRELKLRLLNGTHTFSSGLAHLAGFDTVREAMENEEFSSFVRDLALGEIAAVVSGDTISYNEAAEFAKKVMDRFRNPYLDHHWLNITVQNSSKMRMRNVPLLLKYYEKLNKVPEHIALGFAAFLLFLKGRMNNKGKFEGQSNGSGYIIEDDNAGYFADKWLETDITAMVESVLADKNFWGADLSQLRGFSEAVEVNLKSLMENGAMENIRRIQSNKVEA